MRKVTLGNETVHAGLWFLMVTCLVGGLTQRVAAATYYVRDDGVESAAGTSWTLALKTITNAIAKATAGEQVWVKAGTYKPTTDTDRSKSFVMKNGVDLYGGFAGTETDLSERDWKSNPTYLSGNIGDTGTHTDNSYHVIQAADGRIDGFIIQDGYADGAGNDVYGGGVYADEVNMILANCVASNNYAKGSSSGGGGAMYWSLDNAPVVSLVSNCLFTSNSNDISSGGRGGAIHLDGDASPGTAAIIDCDFVENTAYASAALFMYYISPEITRCTFTSNTSQNVGGVSMLSSARPRYSQCVFAGNRAMGQSASVIYATGSGLADLPCTFVNCVFRDNTSASSGGAFYLTANFVMDLTNCTFHANAAGSNGGVMHRNTGSATFENCIIWSNTPSQFTGDSVTCNWSIVKGGYAGPGTNIMTADPKFVDTTYLHIQSTAGNYIDGYFSGGTWSTSAQQSPAIDAGNPVDNASLEPHYNGGRINLGAYGNTAVASLTPPPAPIGTVILVR